jgi:linoleate 10R-lipoxygenase
MACVQALTCLHNPVLMRTFSRNYSFNSVYGLFPFSTPEATRKNLTDLEKQGKVRVEDYDFKRPSEGPIPKVLNTFTAIKHVFNDTTKYKVPYGPDMR